MGLQIGNSKVKEVKIGEIGTSTDYTFTNQPDFTLESQGAFRGVRLIDPFELNTRIKGTLTLSVSKQYDVYMQQSDGTMKYSSVTGNVINFDAYCVNTNSHAVSLYWKASDGIQALSCDIFFNLTNPVLQMSLNVNFDYIKDTVTVNLTNFQYGTLSTTPTVSYHNIKEIYVGSNKVFPVKQTGWVTAWEGTFNHTTPTTANRSGKFWFEGSTLIEGATKYRITGTVSNSSYSWVALQRYIEYRNINQNMITVVPNTYTYDLSNIEMGSDPYVTMAITTSSGQYYSGTKSYFGTENNQFRILYQNDSSHMVSQTFNITKIEGYIPE